VVKQHLSAAFRHVRKFRWQHVRILLNLTDQQQALLRLLVANHELYNGAAFIFVHNHSRAGLCYPGGVSVSVENDESDFHQLARENLVNFTPVSQNVYRGKPTQSGITSVNRALAKSSEESIQQSESLQPVAVGSTSDLSGSAGPPAPARKRSGSALYEEQCALLTSAARSLLNRRAYEREAEIDGQIQVAESHLHDRQGELGRLPDERERKAAEAHLREMKMLQEGIVKVATNLAAEGVREFAAGLLLSQGRLGVHAVLLREYTAKLVTDIRDRLSTSPILQIEAQVHWRQDPVMQAAIQACERILWEQRKLGDGPPLSAEELNGSNPGWSSIVEDWEALKAAEGIKSGPEECIPESCLRTILSSHHATSPEDLTPEQIHEAEADLCRHYGRILVIPIESEAGDPPEPTRTPVATSTFWKEREDEFRMHDTGEKGGLRATWFSFDGHWTFHSRSGMEAPSPGSDQIFKSLARVAATGFGDTPGAETWIEWLHALRRVRDKSTGKPLYSKLSTAGRVAIADVELERMKAAGEPIPPGGMIEIVFWSATSDPSGEFNAGGSTGATESCRVWDTRTEDVERLFEASANFCLELRSRVTEVPDRKPQMPGQQEHQPPIGEETTHLPKLSALKERELALRWQQVLEERDLTGKHFQWHDRVRDRSGRIVMRPGVDRTFKQIGVAKSVVVAELHFKDFVRTYFEIWDHSGEKHEIFKDWLPSVTRRVLQDMAGVWKARDIAIDEWYEKVCEPTIKDTLGKLETEWRRRARDRELLKLERVTSSPAFRPGSVLPHLRPAETRAGAPAPQDRDQDRKPIDPVAHARRDLLAAFKNRGRSLGLRITDEMVAKAANGNWNDRTMVTWWKRNDPRCKPYHDKKIRSVLENDPSSLWQSALPPSSRGK